MSHNSSTPLIAGSKHVYCVPFPVYSSIFSDACLQEKALYIHLSAGEKQRRLIWLITKSQWHL